jgi:hypothetical protein
MDTIYIHCTGVEDKYAARPILAALDLSKSFSADLLGLFVNQQVNGVLSFADDSHLRIWLRPGSSVTTHAAAYTTRDYSNHDTHENQDD